MVEMVVQPGLRGEEGVRGGARTPLLRGREPPFAQHAHEAVDAKRGIPAEGPRS